MWTSTINAPLQACNDYEATVRAEMHMKQLIAKYLCNKICEHVDDFDCDYDVYIMHLFVILYLGRRMKVNILKSVSGKSVVTTKKKKD